MGKTICRSKLALWCKQIIVGLTFLVMVFLTIESLFRTCTVDTNNDYLENIVYKYDNWILNILVLILCVFLFKLIYPKLKKIDSKWLTLALMVYTLIIGLVWIFSVQSSPTEDSYIVTSAAKGFSVGDYSALTAPDAHYFQHFPFQLGYVFYSEVFIRLFGLEDNFLMLQVLNLIFLCLAYWALIKISGLIFQHRSAKNITAVLLFGFFPGILFCTFLYGNIPSVSVALWAVVFEMLYIKSAKRSSSLIYAFISALLIGVAVSLKANAMIILAAMCIIMVVHVIKTKQVKRLLYVLLSIVLALGVNQAVVYQYELRTETSIGSGIPKICWAAMGLNESIIQPGWYSGQFTVGIYDGNNHDGAATSKAAMEIIGERTNLFLNDRDYAREFFYKKTVSQWNEVSYQSIWSSEVRGHYQEPAQFVNDIYSGDTGKMLTQFMNFYQQFIFAMMLIALFRNFKKPNLFFCLVALMIFGGFLYHSIFEGKSQYVLTYVLMMIPLAANGIIQVLNTLQVKQTTKKRKVLLGRAIANDKDTSKVES